MNNTDNQSTKKITQKEYNMNAQIHIIGLTIIGLNTYLHVATVVVLNTDL